MQKCRSNVLDNNDLVKFTSSRGDNSATNDSMVMKIAHAELYITSNIQYCRIISVDNNNSVKFISSRGDNSTTNDGMVMKIEHAQLDMYTNIMYKFQSSTCKTRRKAPDKIVSMDGWTDGRAAMAIPVYPPSLRCGGYKKEKILVTGMFSFSAKFSKASYVRVVKVSILW